MAEARPFGAERKPERCVLLSRGGNCSARGVACRLGSEARDACLRAQRSQRVPARNAPQWQAEACATRGPDGFLVVRVAAAWQQARGGPTEGQSAAEERAQVAWVLYTVQQQHAARRARLCGTGVSQTLLAQVRELSKQLCAPRRDQAL